MAGSIPTASSCIPKECGRLENRFIVWLCLRFVELTAFIDLFKVVTAKDSLLVGCMGVEKLGLSCCDMVAVYCEMAAPMPPSSLGLVGIGVITPSVRLPGCWALDYKANEDKPWISDEYGDCVGILP